MTLIKIFFDIKTMSNDIFDNNFSKLKAFNSNLAIALNAFSLKTEYEIFIDEGKEIGLTVDGRQLCSHHNRDGYAQKRINLLNLKQKITIYGFGIGDEIRAILNKNPKASIDVVLLNPALFYALLGIDDEIYKLFVPNINFIIPEDRLKVVNNAVISFPELYIDPKNFNSLKMRLMNYLDNDFSIKEFNRVFKGLIETALKNNYELLKNEKLLDTDDLNDITDTVIVTAAGPSLEDNIETVKTLKKQGHTIIAVDASLACLEKYHIIPDYVVSCDIWVYKNLKNSIFKDFDFYKNSTLVYSATSEKELITKFTGKKRFIFKPENTEILDFLPKEKANFLIFYGSVLNEAVSLALKAKPHTIKLFGADFAFKDSQTHSTITDKAVISVGEVKVNVLCNDGKIQSSQRNFCFYREELEKEIELHKEVRFENYSKTGAVIQGAHFIS